MSRHSPFGIIFGAIFSALVLAPVFLPEGLFRHIVIQAFPIVGAILASFAGAGSVLAIIRRMNNRAVERPSPIQDGPSVSS